MGETIFINGNKYVGGYKDGLKSGECKVYFASGGRYEGNFERDVMHGRGTYYYPSGISETGDRVNGIKEGEAI